MASAVTTRSLSDLPRGLTRIPNARGSTRIGSYSLHNVAHRDGNTEDVRVHGRVDTRPRFQEIHLSDWDSVSTQSVVVLTQSMAVSTQSVVMSTLDPASRRPFFG
ncbi:hypothetical protein Taro_049265 [Colocasia esculenta]|uniref:Uncharacterized protein n=1 Tax=Colocasia esculenta TaxID=4460 RepID=A0A843XAD0_COLES|nr:hypothetical protein [Colocasia esculenta]